MEVYIVKDLEKLLQEVTIYKMNDIKPNYSELARIHDCDRRTVKNYFGDNKCRFTLYFLQLFSN